MIQKSRPRRNEKGERGSKEEDILESSNEKSSRSPQSAFNLSNSYSSAIPTYYFTTMHELLSFCFYYSLHLLVFFFLFLCSLPFLPVVSCPCFKTIMKRGRKWHTQKPKVTYPKYENLLKTTAPILI